MRERLLPRVVILLLFLPLLLLLSSCQLLGGSTQVSFLNNTSFELVTIQFGPLTVSDALAPAAQTGNYTVPPGSNVLTAESQGGTWTNAILLSIAVGHSYLITFNPGVPPTFSQVTVSMTATN
jgi:hypothetical protein